MNEYFIHRLARERQVEYLRQVEHDELVMLAHLATRDRALRAPTPERAPITREAVRAHHLWRDMIGHLAHPRMHLPGHRS